jgi:hypothetical protein
MNKGCVLLFSLYVTGKSGSIWPAALAHGTNNAVTGLAALFLPENFSLDNTFYFGVIISIPYLLFGIAFLMISVWKTDTTTTDSFCQV